MMKMVAPLLAAVSVLPIMAQVSNPVVFMAIGIVGLIALAVFMIRTIAFLEG